MFSNYHLSSGRIFDFSGTFGSSANAFISMGAMLAAGAVAVYLGIRPASSQTPAQIERYQEMLIWTGDYDGIIDGELGRGTRAAIRKFQSRLHHKPSGHLTP